MDCGSLLPRFRSGVTGPLQDWKKHAYCGLRQLAAALSRSELARGFGLKPRDVEIAAG
ncbi:MAG: hypothetical protein AMXMBFR4_08230 [Candidatus Hydrogenedentota bacterium]